MDDIKVDSSLENTINKTQKALPEINNILINSFNY